MKTSLQPEDPYDQVSADELFAAGATFTLIAWGFAGGTSGDEQTFFKLLFLSFTNLSATGLSDIVPVTPPAQVLVMLEQFAGIAYLAVVVSRLVGLTIMRQKRKREP